MSTSNTIEDLIIIGSGPAAFSACLYTEELNPLLLEGSFSDKMFPGGQLMTTTDVDNYPGFPDGIKGPQLIKNMRSQIKRKTIEQTVKKVELVYCTNDSTTTRKLNIDKMSRKYYYRVITDESIYYSYMVIIATGAMARRLFVPGTNDNEYWQKGVSACAVCDGWAYKNKVTIVIGGGDSAMEEAGHLSRIASKVYIVHRSKQFKAKKEMLNKILEKENVELLVPYTLKEVKGEKRMNSAILINAESGEEKTIFAEGLFFGIGHDPNSNLVEGCVKRDDDLYIVTEMNGSTNCPGLFSCGDVQDKKYRQAITAAASGARVSIAVKQYFALNIKNKV